MSIYTFFTDSDSDPDRGNCPYAADRGNCPYTHIHQK